jgi:hypothetical protein
MKAKKSDSDVLAVVGAVSTLCSAPALTSLSMLRFHLMLHAHWTQ